MITHRGLKFLWITPWLTYTGIYYLGRYMTKDGFFSESSIHFLDVQISKKNIPKNYPELEIQISRQLQYTVVGHPVRK